jgi:hypothetical protein
LLHYAALAQHCILARTSFSQASCTPQEIDFAMCSVQENLKTGRPAGHFLIFTGKYDPARPFDESTCVETPSELGLEGDKQGLISIERCCNFEVLSPCHIDIKSPPFGGL